MTSGKTGAVNFERPPSRVIHVRNVPTDTAQEELLSIFAPFGAVEKVVLLKTKKQAMVQMKDLSAAINFVSHSTTSQLKLGGRNVYAGFSVHSELNAENAFNKILLVTFYNSLHEQLGESLLGLVNVDFVFQLFSPYGQIHKIVMMNKDAGIQALVQFFQVEGAVRAKTALGSYTFYAGAEFGNFTIDAQFSHLTDLTVRTNTDRARDFLNPNLQPYYPGMEAYQAMAAYPGMIPGMYPAATAAAGVAPPATSADGAQPGSPMYPSPPMYYPGMMPGQQIPAMPTAATAPTSATVPAPVPAVAAATPDTATATQTTPTPAPAPAATDVSSSAAGVPAAEAAEHKPEERAEEPTSTEPKPEEPQEAPAGSDAVPVRKRVQPQGEDAAEQAQATADNEKGAAAGEQPDAAQAVSEPEQKKPRLGV
eukprot:TRINITY_DN77_c2_g1_i3.p1 TRINITY_DN77_c2_g1~~TRINITY_DN77_c2_g1_i3.p1  ORF type:complete len:423 (-),score=127.47 TRINITY_DN77_c2_g1_i3:80-1348(-)